MDNRTVVTMFPEHGLYNEDFEPVFLKEKNFP